MVDHSLNCPPKLAGISRKMSVNKSFHLVMRNYPAGRLKNRKKAGFFHSSFGRFIWCPLARNQKSDDDVDVSANPPTVKQNRVGGFRLKVCGWWFKNQNRWRAAPCSPFL